MCLWAKRAEHVFWASARAPQFGHGEMFGVLVKVLLPRRLLEDAVPADFGVELDLPLSTTTPCHELSFQRDDRLRDFGG